MSFLSGVVARTRRIARPAPRVRVERPAVLPPFFVPTTSRRWRIAKGTLLTALVLFCFVYGFFYALFTPYLMAMFTIPLGVLAVLAIWALPDLRHPPTRTMAALFYAYFICMLAWPNYLAFAFPGMPWITLMRLTGIPMAFLLLVSLSVSQEFRSTLFATINAIPLLWRLLVAFVVIQFVLVPVSPHPSDSLQKVMLSQVNWTAVFFISCYFFLKPGRVERFAALFWGLAVGLSLLGVWEHHLGHVPWRDHIPFFLKIPDEFVDAVLNGSAREAIGVHRVETIFTTPVGFAEFLALTVPFVVHFIAGKYNPRIKLLAIASLPLMMYAVNATDSRSGSVGFFLTFLFYPLALGLLRWRRNKASLVGPAVVLSYPFIFCLAVGAALTVHKLRDRLLGNGANAASNQSRSDQWHMGIPKILSHPWGYGSAQSGLVLGYVATGSDMPTIDTYYLRLLLEYGIIGFTIYFAFIIVAIIYAVRYSIRTTEREQEYNFLLPISIALVNFIFIKSVFAQDDNHAIIFMMLGMIVALVHRIKLAENPARDRVAPMATGVPLLPGLVGVAR